MKVQSTVVAVLIFIAVALGALKSEQAKGEPTLAVGTTILNSDVSFGEVGYRWGKWEANLGLIGEGDTKKGDQELSNVYSLSRVIEPDWRVGDFSWFMRVGVAKVDESPLVGDTNYRLGFGVDYSNLFKVEYVHYSSAGIHDTNTGIDGVMLRFELPLK